MRDRHYILCMAQPHWRLIVAGANTVQAIDLPTDQLRLDDKAAAILRDALREQGYEGEGLLLGLPSDMVLSATIGLANLPRRNRHQAMLYRLEEQLPLPAEALVADFSLQANSALGLAVEFEKLGGTLQELDSAGIHVQAIAPLAMLALQGLSLRPGVPGTCFLAVAIDGRIELVFIDRGKPTRWQSIENDGCVLARTIKLDLLNRPCSSSPLPVLTFGLGPMSLAGLEELSDLCIRAQEAELDPSQAAGRIAQGLLFGKIEAWFNLRRDQLSSPQAARMIRRPLKVLGGMTILVLALAIGMLFWRSYLYGRSAEQAQARQEATFSSLYPGQAMPTDIHMRLDSESKKLWGMRGSSGMPARSSALDGLRQVISGLPGNVRLRVLDLRFESEGFVIEGQAKSHGDAETIASALRKLKDLQVESPRTEQLAGEGVSFIISGRLVPVEKGSKP